MRTNKKILFIINGLGFGGAETQLIRLSQSLINKGFDVSIITLTKDLSLINRLDDKIKHYNIPLQKNISVIGSLRSIFKIVNRIKPNIIHAHLFQANIISRLIKFLNGKIKVINTTHCNYDEENILGISPYKFYKLTKKWVDFHTAVSTESLIKLKKNNAVGLKNNSFIPNGLFVDEYTKYKKSRNPVFKWVAIGRLIPVKNYALLISACNELKKNHSSFILHIVGDGLEKNKLESLMKQYNLENNISLLGIINNIPKLLSNYDALVISSNSEGLPMVLLEAMSAKLPIVSTNVGEIGNILSNSKGGLLTSKKQVKQLANQMTNLMNKDKVELLKMGENNYSFVKKKYDMDIVITNWIKLYNI